MRVLSKDDHAIFWKHEPVIKKISHTIARSTYAYAEFDDIYQDACLLFLTLLDSKKINIEKLTNSYLWQRVGQYLKRKLAILLKHAITIQNQGTDLQCAQDAFSLCLASTFLSRNELSTFQKQLLYRFYLLGEDMHVISEDSGLSVTMLHYQRTAAIKLLRSACSIEISHKKLKWEQSALRIWGPTLPKDGRCYRRTWIIRAREGKRGKEHIRYFDTYVSAMNFRALVEEKGMSIFLKK